MVRVSKHKVCCVEPNKFNPVQRSFRRTEIAKISGEEKSFSASELRQLFKDAGLSEIKVKRVNFVRPKWEEKYKRLTKFMCKIDPILEKISILNLIGGSLVVCGEKCVMH